MLHNVREYVRVSVSQHTSSKMPVSPHLLQRVGDVRLHLCVLCKDQTGQQGGTLLWRQRAQDVLKEQLCQQQLVAADLTSYASFQLHCSAAVYVLEGLKNLRETRGQLNFLVCLLR